MSINSVTLLGNVGRDPEIRSAPSGDRIATLSLATSTVWTDKARSETPFSINARDERFRLYEEAYIAEFRHVYEEAVAVQLLGRAAKHVMRLT